MKKVFLKKTIGFIMAAVIAIAAQTAAFTADYSKWAEFDIFMSNTAYGLGLNNSETYANYTNELSADVFAAVYYDLAEIFGAPLTILPRGGLMKRGEVVRAFYTIVKGGEATVDEAGEYFAAEGLLVGRSPGDYQLDAVCTVEEMIAFAVRTYDHIMYINGDDTKGFFWEVKGNGNTVYLLGSVHLADGAMYPMSRHIVDAFIGSKYLVVEADVSELDDEVLAVYMLKYGLILDGGSIADYISPETYELYVTVCETIGLPDYDYYMPWLATLILTSLLASESADPLLGIDMNFLLRAQATGKEIIELESAEFQLNMYASFSAELQDYLLYDTLTAILTPSDTSDAADQFSHLIEIVKHGDEDIMAEILGVYSDTDDPLLFEYNDALFTQRNIGMADKVSSYLDKGGNNYFVIVGAGHLIGAGSVIDLLEKMGYEVTRIR